jgi:hypothetical protein
MHQDEITTAIVRERRVNSMCKYRVPLPQQVTLKPARNKDLTSVHYYLTIKLCGQCVSTIDQCPNHNCEELVVPFRAASGRAQLSALSDVVVPLLTAKQSFVERKFSLVNSGNKINGARVKKPFIPFFCLRY